MRTNAVVCFGVGLAACGLTSVAEDSAMPEPEHMMAGSPTGPWRRLFLDSTVVEEQSGLERVFHAAEKHKGNPVLVADKPWEKTGRYPGPHLFGTVMWDEGKIRMWYRCYTPGEVFCYAESDDGIHWTKPELGIYPHGDSKANNIYLGPASDLDGTGESVPGRRFHTAMVFRQRGDVPAEKRYALFGYMLGPPRHRVAFSADGLRWTFVPGTLEKGLFGGGDASTYGYDPYTGRYFAMRKAGSLGLGGRRDCGRGRAVGIAWCEPDDVLKWTMPTSVSVLVPDDLDPDATQFYNAPTFAYQGVFIAQLWVFHARWFKHDKYTDERMSEAEKGSPATTDVQLAWSWDLVNWTRPPQRRPFIALGDTETDEFDCGSIHTAVAPIVVGDQLFFYYGGARGRYLNPRHHAIGLATLRLDGFCSLRARSDEGWLITRREQLERPEVTINARVRTGGAIVAEILDRNNNVLEGFSKAECVPFTGDSVRHVLRWRGTEFTENHTEGDKKFRFFLENADFYSYLP